MAKAMHKFETVAERKQRLSTEEGTTISYEIKEDEPHPLFDLLLSSQNVSTTRLKDGNYADPWASMMYEAYALGAISSKKSS